MNRHPHKEKEENTFPQYMTLAHTALSAALEANAAIMEVYSGKIMPERKSDGSPITLADKRANSIILKHLKKTGIPVVSEESEIPDHHTRTNWPHYWMVDPLDGTKEFIGRNGEFTVNIALITEGEPVIGVITAPALQLAWTAVKGERPRKIKNTRSIDLFNTEGGLPGEFIEQQLDHNDGIKVAVSRSHLDPKTTSLVRELKLIHPGLTMHPKGSSLKFCDLAEGLANIYPRYTPTFEWDTAAGHAILNAAGGELFDMETKQPLRYTKQELRNPSLIAFADKEESGVFFSQPAFD
ncbi:MAG: 3'(2'),5'-bisphosphate nucleotidase CysQ [Bacteroidales bacterium]